MFYVVYADEVFFINLLMNTILLYMVGKFRGIAATFFRIVIASAIGALAIVFLCIVSLPTVLESIFTLIILPLIMISVSFHEKNIKCNILSLITLYLNSAMMGGMLQIFFYHSILKNCLYMNQQYRLSLLSVVRWIVGIFMTGVLVVLVIRLFHYKANVHFSHCPVQLTIGNKKIIANALIDTGNGLYEPISQQPVCLIHYPIIKNHIHKIKKNTMRIIPVHTINGTEGVIYAYKIDQMDVLFEQSWRHFKDVYVALENRAFGTCQVLLHPDFVSGTGLGDRDRII